MGTPQEFLERAAAVVPSEWSHVRLGEHVRCSNRECRTILHVGSEAWMHTDGVVLCPACHTADERRAAAGAAATCVVCGAALTDSRKRTCSARCTRALKRRTRRRGHRE